MMKQDIINMACVKMEKETECLYLFNVVLKGSTKTCLEKEMTR